MAIKPHTDAARLLSRTGGGHYGAGGPAHRARVKDNKKRVRLESSFLVIVFYPPRPGNAGTDLLRQRLSLTVTAGLAGRSFHRRARLFYSRRAGGVSLWRDRKSSFGESRHWLNSVKQEPLIAMSGIPVLQGGEDVNLEE